MYRRLSVFGWQAGCGTEFRFAETFDGLRQHNCSSCSGWPRVRRGTCQKAGREESCRTVASTLERWKATFAR